LKDFEDSEQAKSTLNGSEDEEKKSGQGVRLEEEQLAQTNDDDDYYSGDYYGYGDS
jgi:hypothetical protein